MAININELKDILTSIHPNQKIVFDIGSGYIKAKVYHNIDISKRGNVNPKIEGYNSEIKLISKSVSNEYEWEFIK